MRISDWSSDVCSSDLLEHIAAVGKAIDRLLGADTPADPQRTALVITHTGFILDYIHADVGHLLVDGRIVGSEDPRTLFSHIQAHGSSTPPVTANVSHTICRKVFHEPFFLAPIAIRQPRNSWRLSPTHRTNAVSVERVSIQV